VSELPSGWSLGTLPDLIASDGVFSDGDWVESKDQDPNGDVRLIQLADVGDGYYRDRSARFLTMAKARQLDCTFLTRGDVLVARMPDPLGRACCFPGDAKPAVTAVDVCIIRPGKGSVNPRWLMHAINAPQLRSAMAPYEKGTTRKRISRSNLGRLSLPVPPLAEQERIVAAIEEQLSRLDTGVAALRSAQRRLQQLRDQDIFALITGKGAKVRLGEICDIRLGRQRSPKNHSGPNMVPYLRAANVTWDGLDLTDVKQMNFAPAEVSTYRLQRGDVLVAEASGSASEVGKPAIWDESIPVCCFQNTLLRLRSERLVSEYLYLVLLALARSGAFARASKGVGIHHLSKAGISNLEIEVPSKETQHELVATITDQQEWYEALDRAISMGLQRASRLRLSVLAAAFSGKLALQDSSDEPASILLKRIAAGRVKSSGRRTRRGRKLEVLREEAMA
jgi:type I restriction enzyme, S subunit